MLPFSSALYLWDYFATIDREVEYVWGQKLSAASVLFISNRYVNLLITILELVEQAPFQTPKVCILVGSTCIQLVTSFLRGHCSCCLQPSTPSMSLLYDHSCPPVIRVLQSLLIFASFIVAGEWCEHELRGLNHA